MVNYQARLDATFAALADPTRRAILARLARGESTVGELSAPFAISPPAVSRHLRVLEGAGLIDRRIAGRIHRCRITPRPLREAAAWIERHRAFWEDRLAALDQYLRRARGGAARGAQDGEDARWSTRGRKGGSRSRSGGRSTRRGSGSSGPGPIRRR